MAAIDLQAYRRARACSWPRTRRARAAFTLLEMLVVISIISIFVGVIGFGFLRGSASSTVGLQASQSIVVGLLTQARSQAVMSSQATGLFLAAGPVGGFSSDTKAEIRERYLRCLVVAQYDGSNWVAVSDLEFLPTGAYVVPEGEGSPRRIPNAIKGEGEWYRCSAGGGPSASLADVDSSALDEETNQIFPYSTDGLERWMFLQFTPTGTKKSPGAGAIALATGDRQPAANATTSVVLSNPDNVRGVMIRTSGQFQTIDRRCDL